MAFCLDDFEFKSDLGQVLNVNLKSRTLPAFNDAYIFLKQRNLEDSYPIINFEQCYISPWAPSYDNEITYEAFLKKVKGWVIVDETSDPILMTLSFCIVGLNSDFLALRNKRMVEKLQAGYLNMLRRYLTLKFGKIQGRIKLAEFMGIVSLAREAAEIASRRLPC